jgi:hypothetical protein
MASKRSRRWRGEGEAYQTPRCIPGRHGGAVPARPPRRGRGKSSPQHHREHRTRHFHRCAHTLRAPRRSTACVREKPARYLARWRQRCEIPSGILPRISSERRWPTEWFGGDWRGRRGGYSAQIDGGGARRSQPESPGNGGAIRVPPERSSGERVGENEREQCGLGRFDRPRPGPCWASRIGGLVWLLGQDQVLNFWFFSFSNFYSKEFVNSTCFTISNPNKNHIWLI